MFPVLLFSPKPTSHCSHGVPHGKQKYWVCLGKKGLKRASMLLEE